MLLFKFLKDLFHLNDALPNLIASIRIWLVKSTLLLDYVLVLLDFVPPR